MAYGESSFKKLKKLLRHPGAYIPKIVPYLKSKITPYQRDLYELFGNDKYSKPYPGHEKILELVTKSDGFFVQCGGNDGYFNDPTYYLEKKLGWKGIIVEPLPIANLCKRNRKKSQVVQKACVPFSHTEDTVRLIDCNAMSFVQGSRDDEFEYKKLGERAQKIEAREVIVPAVPVQQIIDEHRGSDQNIDLFVADVEGYELEILQGLDFSKNSPTHIVLEIQNQAKLDEITNFLSQHGYGSGQHVFDNDYIFTCPTENTKTLQ